MSGGFRRSSVLGAVGVVVVMIACAAIALEFGGGTSHPQGALTAIVAVVFGFIAILIVLRWKSVTVEGGDAGIAVERRSDSGSDWLCDLWLAERPAGAVKARRPEPRCVKS